MWVYIPKASSEPAAVGIRVATPTFQLGSVEPMPEVLRQALVFGRYEVGSLVMNHRPWRVCLSVLLPHLLEDSRKNMLYELRNIHAVVQVCR